MDKTEYNKTKPASFYIAVMAALVFTRCCFALFFEDVETVYGLLIPLFIYTLCLILVFIKKYSAIIACSAFMFYTGLMATTTTGIKIAVHEFYAIDILMLLYIIFAYIGGYKLLKQWNAINPKQKERKL